MPAYFLLPLAIFLFSAVFLSGIALIVQYMKGRQLENHIKDLELKLTTANTMTEKYLRNLNLIQQNSEFEKYAGLVLGQMDRAVILIDRSGIVRLINDKAKKFLDLTAATGMPYKDIIHMRIPGEKDNYLFFEEAFTGKVQQLPNNIELVNQTKSYPLAGSIFPLMTGQSIGFVAFIFEDNSKQVSRVKEEQGFFSAAAHELRTPLTVIRMTVSLLKEKFDTLPREKIVEHLRRTDETTERLVRLVNEFLSISRIDQGRLDLKTEILDIVELTDKVIEELAMLAKKRNLYVHHESNIPVRMVAADRTKATEVLNNLIGNGLLYTNRGGVTISHAISDSTLTTSVTDTGTGIPHDAQKLLFKRFGQVGDSQQHIPTKSAGLGLYISKKFAELMRGDVTLVKSEPGSGSTFAFTLPLG